MGSHRKKVIGNQFKGRGMFLQAEAGAVLRNTEALAELRGVKNRASWLANRQTTLLKRLDVAVAEADERSSEIIAQLGRRFDLGDRLRRSRRRGSTEMARRPTSYQKGQAREQSAALRRLQDKSQRAHKAIEKIERDLAAIEAEQNKIDERIAAEGNIEIRDGEKFDIFDKIKDGKITHRVFMCWLKSLMAEYTNRGTWEIRGGSKGKYARRDFTKEERVGLARLLCGIPSPRPYGYGP